MVLRKASGCLQAPHTRRARSLILTSVVLAGVTCFSGTVSFCFAVSALANEGLRRPRSSTRSRRDGDRIFYRDYAVGDDVKARSPDDDRWYPGIVAEAHPDGTFRVRWDDPEGGPETNDMEAKDMRKIKIFKAYKVDDFVHVADPDDGRMYPGTVVQDNRDGTFQIRWEDPDGGPEECTVNPKKMRYPPIPLDELKVGQRYTGTVKGIQDGFAFVDIGAVKDGFLHISMMSQRRIKTAHEVLEENQELDVWVSKLEPGRFRLTSVESLLEVDGSARKPAERQSTSIDLAPFARTSSEDWFEGTVSSLKPFGAFVTVELKSGESADGLIHISQLSDGFVRDVASKVDLGQKVMVRIVKVDAARGTMSLSMKAGASGVTPVDATQGDLNIRAFASTPPDQWLTGRVKDLKPYGAFVKVTSPTAPGTVAVGLVHITQIKHEFVESVWKEFTVGQEVQVRVLSVDEETNAMSLTTKPIIRP